MSLHHERATRIDRPDSATDPHPLVALDDDLRLTTWERIVLFGGIGIAGTFGVMVGHFYYVWFLKP